MQESANRLEPPVDLVRDHALGGEAAEITLLEFGSFNCPSCFAAHDIMASLRDRFGERMRYVFRHRPITGDPQAQLAAEIAEYAHETGGGYWKAHDALMKRGPTLEPGTCERIKEELGLPPATENEAAWQRARARVAEDRESARRSGAVFSPTFFINGRRYEGPWDEASLAEAMVGSLGHRLQAAALDFARWAPSTGLLLLSMTLLAVALVNSPLGARFEAFWSAPVGIALGEEAFRMPLRDWVNDGLLTIFFFVVGLEIKRELTVGRLATRRTAALPLAAAIGGMLLPALIYLATVRSGPLAAGWAIPTTTDTAFAIAVVAALGPRVPVALRIFLTAAVVVDDLAAIGIVAVFYASQFDAAYAAAAACLVAAMIFMNRNGIYRPLPYGLLALALWACLHAAGLHATLAGVIAAAATPTRPPPNLRVLMAQAENVLQNYAAGRPQGGVLRHGPPEPVLRALDAIHDRIESPASKLLRAIEPWSSYFVLPVFALANAGLPLSLEVMSSHMALMAAIVLGLVAGKPLGMLAAAALAVRLGVAAKPEAYTWRQLVGAASLAGIGFTMSLYIAGKSFPDPAEFAAAKMAIFIASLLAAALGTALLASAPQVDEDDARADGERRGGEGGA